MSALPPREFARAVRDFAVGHDLLPMGAGVIVGVSGGPDSMALLRVLHEWAAPFRWRLRVAHLDHALRRNSVVDARFVRAAAGRMGLPFVAARTAVETLARRRKISPEEAGRLARYSFLVRTARRLGATRIAVGHHADDQAETVLMRLIRGAAGTGLSGMAPARSLHDPLAKPARRILPAVTLVRPLLGRTRAEILAYLKARQQRWRTDPTNRSPDHLRNRIRARLLPLLTREYNPNIRAVLARAATTLAADESFLEDAVDRAWPRAVQVSGRRITIRLVSLLRLHPALQARLLRRAAVAAGADPRRLAQSHLDALARLARIGTGAAHLPGCRASAVRHGVLLRPVPLGL